MPELPEVEHFKKYFNKTSPRKPIKQILCKNKKLLSGGSLATITKLLKGKSFLPAHRRGKFLIVPIAGSDKKVVFHFGLTGFFHYKKAKEPVEKNYAKIIFIFNSGDALQFINKRNFGHVYIVTDPSSIKTIKTMGPEATTIRQKEFNDLLKNHAHANVKTFLMDQSMIAGIGNDYSNEILFAARIYPGDTISKLSTMQKKQLYLCMKRILKKAIGLAITERKENFPQSWLLAHKKDMHCPKSKDHRLKKMSINGRTALYCPFHQNK